LFRYPVNLTVHRKSPETLRGHTLKIGEQLRHAAAVKRAATAAAIAISVDSTFIRSRHDGERHLEVRIGNVETPGGGRQAFAAATKTETDIAVLIRRNLEAVGRTDSTDLTAFTGGCPSLRSVLANVDVTKPPILDWFHIAMRPQHATQAASRLAVDGAARMQAKTVIIEQVERLRWRIWNGKASNVRFTIERIYKVLHVFKVERGHRTMGVPSRKLWRALHEVDNYLSNQSNWLVDYAKRYCAGLRVGTSITEGTANPTDAMVSTRGRPAAPGPMCGLQRRSRFRVRPSLRAGLPPTPAIRKGGLITPLAGHARRRVSAGRTSPGASRAGMAAWSLRHRHQRRRSDVGKSVVLPNHPRRLRGGRHA